MFLSNHVDYLRPAYIQIFLDPIISFHNFSVRVHTINIVYNEAMVIVGPQYSGMFLSCILDRAKSGEGAT